MVTYTKLSPGLFIFLRLKQISLFEEQCTYIYLYCSETGSNSKNECLEELKQQSCVSGEINPHLILTHLTGITSCCTALPH